LAGITQPNCQSAEHRRLPRGQLIQSVWHQNTQTEIWTRKFQKCSGDKRQGITS